MQSMERTAKDYFEDQVRSRDRVRDLAEVYTHNREVNAMLNLVAEMFPSEEDPDNIDRTFLEPACGHGNFLVAIIGRKIQHVTLERYGEKSEFEYRLLRCFTSTYGIDIDEGNIIEARERMFMVLEKHLRNVRVVASRELLSAVSAVLGTNVLQADTLADANRIELVEYKPVGEGFFLRVWSPLEENEGPEQLDLFGAQTEPKSDGVPVHYTRLASRTMAVHI